MSNINNWGAYYAKIRLEAEMTKKGYFENEIDEYAEKICDLDNDNLVHVIKEKMAELEKMKDIETFSKNSKLNKVLNRIYSSLLNISDTKDESIEEVKRYKKSFQHELDYNIAQHGHMIIANYDIRMMYTHAGYHCSKWSNEKILKTYYGHIGYVVRIKF